MVDIQLYVDGELVTTYSCDGLIVSTPVGSTAHNLSAGGPILRNNLQAFVFSRSRLTLTNRRSSARQTAHRDRRATNGHGLGGRTASGAGARRPSASCGRRGRLNRQSASYYRTLREKLGWAAN
jgi:NAD+ kinase